MTILEYLSTSISILQQHFDRDNWLGNEKYLAIVSAPMNTASGIVADEIKRPASLRLMIDRLQAHSGTAQADLGDGIRQSRNCDE